MQQLKLFNQGITHHDFVQFSFVCSGLHRGNVGCSCASRSVFYSSKLRLRTLKLSVSQRVQLQSLRQHYKAESDRIVREIRNNRGRIELSGLFEKGMFDPTHARRVAYERYADEMAQTVEELRFYHDMYQILTPEQQKMWLNLCIKH